MTLNSREGISYISSEYLDQSSIVNGFFMRHGGVSSNPWKSLNMATSVGDSRENVIENRKRLAQTLNIEPNRFYDVWQVHGNDVIVTIKPRPLDQNHLKADAITTNRKNIYLLMLFGDCVPIMLYDDHKHAIGIAHAGWKGTLNNVAGELVSRMQIEYGTEPGNLFAVIGPCICQSHYQVGHEIGKLVEDVYQNSHILHKNNGDFFFDLSEANAINLRRSGVDKIEQTRICTSCQNEDWFSHRAENGQTGRFAAVIGLS